MSEHQYRVVVDPDLPERLPEDVVAVGNFQNSSDLIYSNTKIATGKFFGDLILGKPLPLTLAMRSVSSIGDILILALFLHRDLAINPKMPELISASELVDQLGIAGYAHIDRYLGRFFRLCQGYLSENSGKSDFQSRLETVISWIKSYLFDGELPSLPPEIDPPRIVDRGTDGFVVAELAPKSDMRTGWIELYRQGFLRGVLVSPLIWDRRHISAARKSLYLKLDLHKAADIFNTTEEAMGEPPNWEANDTWLTSPPEGTLILVSHIVSVLLHVG